MAKHKIENGLSRLDADRLEALHGRSMLLTQDWTRDEIDELCSLAELLQDLDFAGQPPALFPQQLFYALFFDQSTRTKSSWAGAASRLGGQPVIVDGSSTQVSHGETARETGAMLGMNSHAMGIRHDLILGEGNRFMRDAKEGIDSYLEATGDDRVVPIVNLQCDVDHPTQSLADLLWLREQFPDGLEGKTITMSWAYSPSYAKPLSVAQGIITLLTRFGMNVRLAHPKGYGLMERCMEAAKNNAEESGGSFTVTHDMDEGFADADIVYPKSWGPYDLMLERVNANRQRDRERLSRIERSALERNKTYRDWICDDRRMGLTREGDALYMHCLPADIGDEVSRGVMEKAKVNLAREANKKVYAIMALLAVAKSKGLKETLAAHVKRM